MTRSRILLLVAVWLVAAKVQAHKPSDSYLRLQGGGEFLAVEWDIALKDLEFLIGLDADLDGNITWGEVKSSQREIEAHALSRLQISTGDRECELLVKQLLINRHSDGAYVVLEIETDCPGEAPQLTVNYSLLFDVDPTHRGLVLYDDGDEATLTRTRVLSPEKPMIELRRGEAGMWHTFVEFTKEGVWHIWIGFDHILFLLSLLLPAVLVLRDSNWEPVDRFGPACWKTLKIVTMFTIAHSITLWLAVMDIVEVSGRWVEATIAFSIVVTALLNLFPVINFHGSLIAFGFGLVHGFGFAYVLRDLGLQDVTLAISLFAFNVGVELGQLAIVLVFFPIAYLMRERWIYRRGVLQVGSIVIAIIATLWMIERIGNLEFMPF